MRCPPAQSTTSTDAAGEMEQLAHWDCWGWLGDRTVGLLLSLLLVKETHAHAQHESELHGRHEESDVSQTRIFLQTSLRDCDLSSITQAGFVNNLNDGTAWGLFPVFFAAAGMSLERIGWLAAIYPATWGSSSCGRDTCPTAWAGSG
jgi:hypothetical protein